MLVCSLLTSSLVWSHPKNIGLFNYSWHNAKNCCRIQNLNWNLSGEERMHLSRRRLPLSDLVAHVFMNRLGEQLLFKDDPNLTYSSVWDTSTISFACGIAFIHASSSSSPFQTIFNFLSISLSRLVVFNWSSSISPLTYPWSPSSHLFVNLLILALPFTVPPYVLTLTNCLSVNGSPPHFHSSQSSTFWK